MINSLAIANSKDNSSNVTFTKDQELAVHELIEFIAQPWDDKKYINALCGAGGTGKTFVIKYVIENCKWSNSVIGCAAPTHKACRVLSNSIGGKKVQTIQSLFGFRLDVNIEDFDPRNPAFNPIGKDKLEGLKLLIVDEASMLNSKLVKYISDKCKKHDIKIIFLGDSHQLAPVKESTSTAFLIASKTYYLKEIVRQDADNPISKLLKLLREDINNSSTWDFLNYIAKNKQEYNDEIQGFYVCNKNEFSDIIDTCFNNEEYTRNINMFKVIAYTNNCVSYWNNYIRNSIIKEADKSIITRNDLFMSNTTIVDIFNDIVINNSDEYIVKDIIDTVDNIYEFKGFLIKFQAIYGGHITNPLFIIDHRDSYTFQMYYKTLVTLINDAKNSINDRAAKWRAYFDFKRKYLIANNITDISTGKILFKCDIDYGFAITSHKSQGSTYKNVFIDINDMIYDKHGYPYTNRNDILRRLYVACSRASNQLVLCYGK